ncbi:MAG: single-stranded DNA-binding protein [Candidatus Cloacimonadota bacterium]|nr:single-stranded DNA-binding protein [Candidatus Cloacimonadota bacterium]
MSKNLRFPQINHITISGRLTRDVELRYTPNGVAVTSLSIAFDRNYKKDGEWVNEANFTDVVVWNEKAEQCAKYLSKGSPILVEGYLKTRTYQTKDNQNRKVTEIVSTKVNFLEWNESKNDSGNQTKQSNNFEKTTYESSNDVTEDDVPF